MGAQDDVTLTHDGTTGATLAGDPITITSAGAATWSAAAGNLTIDAAAAALTLDGHTGVTVQSTNSGDVTLDSVADVVLDADGDQISMKFGGATGQIDFSNTNSGDGIIRQMIDAKDLIVQQYDGSEVVRFGDDRKLYFYDKGGEHISSDGTSLTIAAGAFVKASAALSASGQTTLGNNTLVSGKQYIGGTLGVSGAISAASTVSGSGQTTFGNNVLISGKQYIGGTLQVSGATVFSNTVKLGDGYTLIFGGNNDWTIKYDEAGDDDLVMTGTTLNVVTDTATFESANSTDPLVTIKNTTDDANGPRLRFVKDKGAAGAANDVAGLIQFYADDASQDQVLFSEIKSQVKVHTNGQEGGKFTVSVAENDGTSTAGLVIEDGDADGELDVTIGAGAASLTTIAGDLDIPNGGFALGSDASGDMYYRNSSGVFTRIAVGSDNHILTLNGAVPGWEAAGAASSLAADDITSGDAAVSIDTSSGDITVDSNAGAVSIDGHTGVTVASSNSGDITLNSAANLAVTADTATFASANANDPLVVIKNTTNDTDGARLRFVKDKGAAGADDDVAGLIEFYADDAAQDQVLFAKITAQVADATNGAEGGKLSLGVATHDGEFQFGLVLADGSAEDEIDVTIGNGADSLTTIAGDLDMPNGGFALGSDASGDMYYRNSSGVFTRIAVGSDNHILTLNGAVPGWEAAGAASSLAADDITSGDAAVSIDTSSGNIVVDSNAGAVSIDGHTGVTIASSNSGNISIDSVAELHLNSTTGDIKLQDGGTDQIAFDLDGTSGVVIMKAAVDSDDMVFQQYDGTEVLRVNDDASLGICAEKLKISDSSSDIIIEVETDAKDLIFKQYDGNEVVRIADDRRLYFYDKGGEYISSDGSTLTLAAGAFVKASAALSASGQTTFANNVLTSGKQYIGGTLGVSGAISAASTVSGSGAGSFGSLTLDGAIALQSAGITAAGSIAGATTVSGSSVGSFGSLVLDGAANLQSAGITNAGSVAGATTVSGSGVGSFGSLVLDGAANLQSAGITNAGSVAGATTVSGSSVGSFGSLVLDGAANLQSAGITNAGSVAGATTVSGSGVGSFGSLVLDGAANLQSAGITNAGSVAGATTISGSGQTTLGNNILVSGKQYIGGTLGVSGAVTTAGDVSIGDDLSLTSDSAVFNMGAGNDATFTHDGTTGLTIAATPISINSTGDLTLDSSTDIVLDAAGGNFEFKDAGTLQFTIDVDGTAGDIDVNLNVDGDDLVFNQYDGTEVVRFTDAAEVEVKDNLRLTSDSAVLAMGEGNDFTITHDGTTGATLAGTPISINSTGDLTLDSSTDIVIDAAGGNVEFKDGGTLQLTLDMDGTGGAQVIKLGVDGDDLVFQQYDGTEVLKLDDAGNTYIGGTLVQPQVAPDDLGDDTNAITISNMLKGISTVTPTQNRTKASDTAANIVGGLAGVAANQSFEFIVVNAATGPDKDITVSAGTGVTIVGSAAIRSEESATFRVRFTNVSVGSEAVTMYRV